MVKLTPGNVDPLARHFARGVYYTRVTKYGWIAQKWPRKGFQKKSPYDYYRNTEFGIAARWASSAPSEEMINAMELAKGSSNVWRDLLTAAAYGTLIKIDMEDGSTLPAQRHVTSNPQYMLDLITEEWGSLLYRAPQGWIGIAPGDNGSVLGMVGQTPAWFGAAFDPGASLWKLHASWDWASNQQFFDVDVSNLTDVQVCLRGVTASVSAFRQIYASVDGGTSYYNTSGNYVELTTTGTETNVASFCSHANSTASARSLYAQILGINVPGMNKWALGVDSQPRMLIASQAQITNLRIGVNTGNMTAGNIRVMGRGVQ